MQPAHIALMETTVTLARSFGVSPFAIMAEDTDDVIFCINYFLAKGNEAGGNVQHKAAGGQKDRFWDF